MKKYKTSVFYELDNGLKFCIATNMETGISKLIGMDKKVVMEVKYDKINRILDKLSELEQLQLEVLG